MTAPLMEEGIIGSNSSINIFKLISNYALSHVSLACKTKRAFLRQ